MNDTTKKLAAAALAAASMTPMTASALPTVTELQQMQQSVEATFGNTFSQTITAVPIGSDSTSALFTALTVSTQGVGAMLTGAVSLAPDLKSITLSGAPGATLGAITSLSAQMTTGIAGSVLSLSATIDPGQASSATVSTTVFAPTAIKATQSVIDSTITTLF